MAIYLTTGTPGAGKTLRTLWKVERERQSSGRDVFYNGINDLKIPGWIQFDDPTKWHELPDKSIIVIDEAQRAFRPRAAVLKVPEHVEALETHRHRGIDIYVITQHPLLIEQNMRRLTESHEHIMRKFGSKWATVHEWKGVKENCDKSRSDSMRSEWRYPKEVFTWYKSAEAHNHKFRLPGKVMVLLCLPFIIALAIWYAMQNMGHLDSSSVLKQPVSPQSTPTVAPLAPTQKTNQRPVYSDTKGWLSQYIQRVDGLPHTAPRYDDLTTPQRVPTIRGCFITPEPLPGRPSRFVCMLDGGVYIYPPEQFVIQYLRDRFFIDWENPRAGDLAALAPRQGDLAAQQTRGTPP
jgi:zona occludens toxin